MPKKNTNTSQAAAVNALPAGSPERDAAFRAFCQAILARKTVSAPLSNK